MSKVGLQALSSWRVSLLKSIHCFYIHLQKVGCYFQTPRCVWWKHSTRQQKRSLAAPCSICISISFGRRKCLVIHFHTQEEICRYQIFKYESLFPSASFLIQAGTFLYPRVLPLFHSVDFFHFSAYFCAVYFLLILWRSSNRGHNWSSAYGKACTWMSWPYFAVSSSRCSLWGRKTSDCELGGVLCWSHEQMCFLAGSFLHCVLLLPSALPSVRSDPC